MAAHGHTTPCDRHSFPYATFHNGEIVARTCYGIDALSLACALGPGSDSCVGFAFSGWNTSSGLNSGLLAQCMSRCASRSPNPNTVSFVWHGGKLRFIMPAGFTAAADALKAARSIWSD